jgi:LacI family transcriptional regulator
VAFAAINPSAPDAASLLVTSDDRTAVRALVKGMIERGHRRVAFAGVDESLRACRERLAGYIDAIQASGDLRIKPIIFESKGISFEDGLAIGGKLLTQKNRPTAVQCVTDDFAAGVIAAAHQRRMVLPEELSVSGFDNFGLAIRLYPALTTATLPVMEMAAAAARQLIDTLEGRVVRSELSLSCQVVVRDSVGPV